MCALTADFDRARAGYSPDRLDALVWGLTELLVVRRENSAGRSSEMTSSLPQHSFSKIELDVGCVLTDASGKHQPVSCWRCHSTLPGHIRAAAVEEVVSLVAAPPRADA